MQGFPCQRTGRILLTMHEKCPKIKTIGKWALGKQVGNGYMGEIFSMLELGNFKLK